VLDAPLDGPVCGRCWSAVRLAVPPLCRRHPPLLDAIRAAGEYEGALRDILHAFKYDGRRRLAAPLGAIMQRAGAGLLSDAHCVVPVPLHLWRRMRRGFNQADDLARHLGPPVVHALWRTRATVPQTGLHAAARRRNVTRAFRLSPFLSRRSRERWLTDRIVVLIDDVRTTGATLNACAAVLMRAGARQVRALTVARAAPPNRQTGHARESTAPTTATSVVI